MFWCKSDKFYYLVDFLILDTQSVVNMESKIPIILGRPFLATANALINCRNGLMKMTFGNMTLEVNVFNIGKQPRDDDECYQTFLIDTIVSEEGPLLSNSDDLESLLQTSGPTSLCKWTQQAQLWRKFVYYFHFVFLCVF